MSGLLEPTYDVPSTGESSFMKFAKGENRFRILDTPIMGYQYWQDDKVPVRIKTAAEAPSGEKPKHFWQVPVWDGHGVIVTRSGDGMDTTYTTTPCPKSPLTDDVKEALAEFKKDYEPDKVFESTPAEEEDLPF